MGNMPNVELLDMEDVLDCCRICGVCPDAGSESVGGQALQAAVSDDRLHEVPLQRMCAPVCFKAPAIPPLHATWQRQSSLVLRRVESIRFGHVPWY